MTTEIMILIAYLAVVNLVTLVMMYADKQRAVRRDRRIPERSLYLAAFLGGGVGSLLGMALFRHKTRKRAFRLGMPAILIAEAALMYYLLR